MPHITSILHNRMCTKHLVSTTVRPLMKLFSLRRRRAVIKHTYTCLCILYSSIQFKEERHFAHDFLTYIEPLLCIFVKTYSAFFPVFLEIFKKC